MNPGLFFKGKQL